MARETLRLAELVDVADASAAEILTIPAAARIYRWVPTLGVDGSTPPTIEIQGAKGREHRWADLHTQSKGNDDRQGYKRAATVLENRGCFGGPTKPRLGERAGVRFYHGRS